MLYGKNIKNLSLKAWGKFHHGQIGLSVITRRKEILAAKLKRLIIGLRQVYSR